MTSTTESNKAVATRFIEAFNTDDWATVREVVASDFVFHHPDGGIVGAGPEGMVAAWQGFKSAVPDAWHPIPILIAEGDFVANLLPTYGHFTGEAYHGIPPTGEWIEYGMVNIARLRDGQLVEAWFGMDSLAEKQQMGAAPMWPPRQLTHVEDLNIELFHMTVNRAELEYDNVTAFGDVVVALGPPQHAVDAKVRTLDIYRVDDDFEALVASHEFPTIPPYGGSLSSDTAAGRAVVDRLYREVLAAHNLDAFAAVVSPDVLIHPTAMPCEAGYYGMRGAGRWLIGQWEAFPDLAVDAMFMVAHGDIVVVRWQARGTSKGSFMMLPPTDQPIEFAGTSMYRIEDGQIAEVWEARDTLGLLRQLNPGIGGAEGHGH